MKKHIAVIPIVFVLAWFCFSSDTSEAQETSGELLREQVTKLKDGVTDIDNQIHAIEAERSFFLEEARGIGDELSDNPEGPEAARNRAELLRALVKVNRLDRDKVELYRGAIQTVLYPSLRNLADLIDEMGAMGHENWASFEMYRDRMKDVIQTGAQLALSMRRLENTLPAFSDSEALRAEASELEGSLRWLDSCLASATRMGDVSGEDIRDQAAALAAVYTKLDVYGSLLGQEAIALKGDLVGEATTALNDFLSGSVISSALDTHETMLAGMVERQDLRDIVRDSRTMGTSRDRKKHNPSSNQQLERMANGKFDY